MPDSNDTRAQENVEFLIVVVFSDCLRNNNAKNGNCWRILSVVLRTRNLEVTYKPTKLINQAIETCSLTTCRLLYCVDFAMRAIRRQKFIDSLLKIEKVGKF